LHENAVSNKNETIEIYKSQAASKRVDLAGKMSCPKQTVEAISINDILDPLEEVAVLKIDCEWSEYDILPATLREEYEKDVPIYHRWNSTIRTRSISEALISPSCP